VNNAIYLDHNSTTPLDDEVLAAMLPFFQEHFGNPSSPHAFGRIARDAVEQARQAVAELIGAPGGSVIFTASATEANNILLTGWMAGIRTPCHVVSSTIEHKSVLAPLKFMEETGRISVTWLRPDGFGQIHPQQLEAAIRPDTRFVSIMAANHVIHTLNNLAALADICASKGILFHTDATQYAGKIPLDANRTGIDALTLSAHKIYGPKGVGALYLSERSLWMGMMPLIRGGGQEMGLRAGTLNVPGIVGFGVACRKAFQRLPADAEKCGLLARQLLAGLSGQFPDISLNGHPQDRIPGGLHITLPGVDSKGLIASVPEIAFSDGAACDADDDPAYVLRAIGKPESAHCSVRFQIGRTNTQDQIQTAIEYLSRGIRRMKSFVR